MHKKWNCKSFVSERQRKARKGAGEWDHLSYNYSTGKFDMLFGVNPPHQTADTFGMLPFDGIR